MGISYIIKYSHVIKTYEKLLQSQIYYYLFILVLYILNLE